ncbi:MAG: chemotaxis protein CheX [Syntrophales bacterium]|nr:chemotaxis protein CheX [Syntrophales bacterium]
MYEVEHMKTDEQSVREIIMKSVFEVFEKMYYIFLEPRDYECKGENRRVVRIRFSGDVSGEMSAYYSGALAESMVENALGVDKDEMNDHVIEDCLKECVNMICGNFLQKLEPDKVLHLSIPAYEGKVAAPQNIEGAGTVYVAFDSEGMFMEIVLQFKNSAG